jgi:hypothetical protein
MAKHPARSNGGAFARAPLQWFSGAVATGATAQLEKRIG